MLLKLVLCSLAFTGGRAAKPDEMVSVCTTQPPKLNSGESGEVHCFFPVDIKDKQFTVDLYKNESSNNRDTIVDCYFIGTQRACKVKDGFNFTCTPGKEQIVRVTKATKQCEGEYRCQILDLEGHRSKHCNVKYEEKREANSQNSKMTVPENAATKEKENMAPEKPETDQTSHISPGVIVGPLVGAVLIGLLVVGVFIIRRTRTGGKPSPKNPIYNPISTNPAVTV